MAPAAGDPGPAPSMDFVPDSSVYNQLVLSAAPRQIFQPPEYQVEGPGVLPETTSIPSGTTLFPTPNACLDFNDKARWYGQSWEAGYANWGTFALDDGGLYRPHHVRFSMEQVIGPGDRHGSEYSFKIASSKPYAAGLVSPVIAAAPGAVVEVRAKYLFLCRRYRNFPITTAVPDPAIRWGTPWFLPYGLQLQDGSLLSIDGQVFVVSGPQTANLLGRATPYWLMVNRDAFVYWDGGQAGQETVQPGGVRLHYDAGSSRLLLYQGMIRQAAGQNGAAAETIQYTLDLVASTAFSAMGYACGGEETGR